MKLTETKIEAVIPNKNKKEDSIKLLLIKVITAKMHNIKSCNIVTKVNFIGKA